MGEQPVSLWLVGQTWDRFVAAFPTADKAFWKDLSDADRLAAADTYDDMVVALADLFEDVPF